jgi:PAS domain-containing protein
LAPDAPVDYDTFLRGLHPEDRNRVDQIVKHALHPGSGGVYVAEYRTIGIDDGKERWLSVRGQVFFDSQGRPIRFIGGGLDVTERKQFDEQLRQMEKQRVESISLLASGIAHDFNNLLGGILASAEVAVLNVRRARP